MKRNIQLISEMQKLIACKIREKNICIRDSNSSSCVEWSVRTTSVGGSGRFVRGGECGCNKTNKKGWKQWYRT